MNTSALVNNENDKLNLFKTKHLNCLQNAEKSFGDCLLASDVNNYTACFPPRRKDILHCNHSYGENLYNNKIDIQKVTY